MREYFVVLAVAMGSVFDTGERIEMRVLAKDRLDAAIIAEKQADATLDDPRTQYTHACHVQLIHGHAATIQLAA